MAYQKRNFKKDQLLTAEDLNAMDDQIASNEESAKKANEDIKNKFDKSAVVQEKGNSKTAVMSQAAATEEFDKLSDDIDALGRVLVSPTEPTDEEVDLWIDADDDEEIAIVTSDDIVQELGDDEQKVLSQAAAKREFNQISEENDMLFEDIAKLHNALSLNFVDGKFLSFSSIETSSGYGYSEPVYLKKGTALSIKAKGYLGNVNIASKVTEDLSSITRVVRSKDSEYRWYDYIVEQDGFYSFSGAIDRGYTITVLSETPNEKIADLEEKTDYLSSTIGTAKASFTVKAGEEHSSNDDTLTCHISKGTKYTVNINHNGESGVFAAVCEIDKEGVGKFNAAQTAPTGLSAREYIASIDIEKIGLYTKSSETDVTFEISVISESGVLKRLQKLEGFESNVDFFGMLFPKMAVIGDSLSSGELVIDGNAIDVYGDSWLSYIARKTNAVKRNHYSAGGRTAKTWLESYTEKLQSDEASNAYFIALGTNDNYRQEYPLGDITDAAGTVSFVGYYKQIIDLVRAKAPNCAIFCVSLYGNHESHHAMSDMISEIANLYDNCFYVDYINNAKIWTSTGLPWVVGSHFTTIGYNYVASVIYKLVCNIVNDNLEFFKFFGKENSVGEKYE